jgi:hypothetical protein
MLKMTDFWDVAPCSLVEIYQRFRGAYCLHYEGNEDSKELWNVGHFLRDYAENSHLHARRRENLKPHRVLCYVKTLFQLYRPAAWLRIRSGEDKEL